MMTFFRGGVFPLIFTVLYFVLPHALSQEHQQHRQSAASLASGVAVSPSGDIWLAGVFEKRLFIQILREGIARWDEKRFIDNDGEVVSTSGDNWPKIAFGPNGKVIISYTKPLSKPYTGEIRLLRSEDQGVTFTKPYTAHQDRQIITHRFDSIVFDQRGDLYVLWIDKRDVEAVRKLNSDNTVSVKNKNPVSEYEGAAIYYNVSGDGGKSFGSDKKVADHSCECCRIAVLSNQGGGISAMWRHVFDGSVRDHAFARLDRYQATSVQRASFDNWVLKVCPHHGPGLARAENKQYHAVWFGEKEGKFAGRYGLLDETGRPIGAVRVLPDERAEHADVISLEKKVVIAWRSFDGMKTSVFAWISDDGGITFHKQLLFVSEGKNDYPRLTSHGNNIFVIWRTESEIHVEKIIH